MGEVLYIPVKESAFCGHTAYAYAYTNLFIFYSTGIASCQLKIHISVRVWNQIGYFFMNQGPGNGLDLRCARRSKILVIKSL